VSSRSKPTPRALTRISPAHIRALDLLADRWLLWILLSLDERAPTRFTELAAAPGLSRRVLSERLERATRGGLVEQRRYQQAPPRSHYLLTPRGAHAASCARTLLHAASGSLPDPAAGATAGVAADALLAGDRVAAQQLYDACLAPVARHDAQYSGALVHTLDTWLAADASTSVAADRLTTHRHTVRYRLERVRDLSGHDPFTTAGREQLLLALRAARVLGHMSSDVARAGG
jgi:DNA-binding HxlR family transcriptional regulator